MPGTGNIFVQTGENNAGIGATAWTNPTNIVSDNTTDATCNAAASSQYLVGRNCGFTVPSTATIRGITVRIEASESSTGAETLNAQLQNESGALFGALKTASVNGTGKVVYTYGSASDLWSATLTPAIVNDADFGVRFWFTTAHNIAVDFVTIAVQYTDNYSLVVDPASYTFTTQTATITVQRKLVGTNAAYNFTTADAGLRAARKLVVTEATYSFTPSDATFVKGYNFGVQEAVYSFTPADVTFIVNRKLSVDPATYSITTADAGLTVQRKLPVTEATYLFTTQNADLAYSGGGTTLPVDPAVYSFTTADAGLMVQRRLTVDPASYSFTPQDATLRAARKLNVTEAEYDFTTQDADFSVGVFEPTYRLIVVKAKYKFNCKTAKLIGPRRPGAIKIIIEP